MGRVDSVFKVKNPQKETMRFTIALGLVVLLALTTGFTAAEEVAEVAESAESAELGEYFATTYGRCGIFNPRACCQYCQYCPRCKTDCPGNQYCKYCGKCRLCKSICGVGY